MKCSDPQPPKTGNYIRVLMPLLIRIIVWIVYKIHLVLLNTYLFESHMLTQTVNTAFSWISFHVLMSQLISRASKLRVPSVWLATFFKCTTCQTMVDGILRPWLLDFSLLRPSLEPFWRSRGDGQIKKKSKIRILFFESGLNKHLYFLSRPLESFLTVFLVKFCKFW